MLTARLSFPPLLSTLFVAPRCSCHRLLSLRDHQLAAFSLLFVPPTAFGAESRVLEIRVALEALATCWERIAVDIS